MASATQQLRHARVPTHYGSRYGLLGRFGQEVAAAFMRAGMEVNAEQIPEGERGFAVFFNVLEAHVPGLLRRGVPEAAQPMPIINWLVDSPLAFEACQWEQAAATRAYRLATTSDEEIQLLKLRWPGIRHACVPHGVDPGALCDLEHLVASHEGAGPCPRDIDVLVTGSIATPDELNARREPIPASLRKGLQELVDLRLEQPLLSFTGAFDLTMPSGIGADEHWDLLSAVFRASTMMINARRRVALVRALQGLNVVVLGAGEWAPHCLGTIRHGGDVAFSEISGWVKRAKVTVALNPPQFTHAISERLLLSLAGGAATVTDDRLLVRRGFCGGTRGAESAVLRAYDVTQPGQARAHVDALLADPGLRVQMTGKAWAEVFAKHLWQHRLLALVALAVDAIHEGTPRRGVGVGIGAERAE